MAELGSLLASTSGSDSIFDFFCELCIEDQRHVEAWGYCVDCGDYLCQSCFSGHTKSRATRHHVLQDKDHMPKDTPLSVDRISKEIVTKCQLHGDKTVEYYCKVHRELTCSSCFVAGHKTCSPIESIAEVAEDLLDSQTYKDFIEKLVLVQEKSRDLMTRARDNKTVSRQCCSNVVSSVKQIKEEVISMLTAIERTVVALAEKMATDDEERMDALEGDCQILCEKIDQLSSEFDSLRSSKRVCQLYVNMRQSEKEVGEMHDEVSKLEATSAVTPFSFEPNVDLTSLLRNPDVLGKIRQQTMSQLDKPCLVPYTQPADIKTTRMADISVKSNNDTKSCGITGSAVVSDGRLLITDCDNNKVKLVDTQTGKLLSELKFASWPWEVALVNTGQAAVTLPGTHKIILVTVADPLTQVGEIPVSGRCRGVAYSQDRLLVTYDDNPRLEIMDLRGNVIRTIQTGSDGRKLFTRPSYVCVSKDDVIYVSDSDSHTVTSLTFDGVVKSVYKDRELSHPRKVCTDHYGNVYVCTEFNRNVHMITADCKKIQVILTQADGLCGYTLLYSVSHCQDTNRLFLGMYGIYIKVFLLS